MTSNVEAERDLDEAFCAHERISTGAWSCPVWMIGRRSRGRRRILESSRHGGELAIHVETMPRRKPFNTCSTGTLRRWCSYRVHARARACASTRSRSRRPCAATRSGFGENEEAWGVVALLHDFDYERIPIREDHPFRGGEILQRAGYPEWVTRAILSHADYTGVPRESRLEKTLFACDEMAGFVTARLARPAVEERARPRVRRP